MAAKSEPQRCRSSAASPKRCHSLDRHSFFLRLVERPDLDISQEIASPITQPSMTSPTRRKPSWMSVNLESLWRSAAMMIAAVIGACSHHDPCARTTYLESRTVTASASGSLQSLLPPITRNNSPTTQPTAALVMRPQNVFTACLTSGWLAAIIELIAQMGFSRA